MKGLLSRMILRRTRCDVSRTHTPVHGHARIVSAAGVSERVLLE